MARGDSGIDRFRGVIEDAQNRAIRVSKIEVISNKAPGAKEKPTFGLPGTMTVFVARKGSPALADLRQAIREGNEATSRMREKLINQYTRIPKSAKGLPEQIMSAPVFADIRYGGMTVNSGVFVPKGVDMAVIILPYNGGRLASEGFTLVEHHKEGTEQQLEAVVMRADPELTDAERAALNMVPKEQLVRNVGVALRCDTTWWAVGLVAAGLVTAAAVGVAGTAGLIATIALTACLLARDVHVSEAQIEKLGPAASARKFIQLRRDVLQERKLRS